MSIDPISQKMRNELHRKFKGYRGVVPNTARESRFANDLVCLWGLFDMLFDYKTDLANNAATLTARVGFLEEARTAVFKQIDDLNTQLQEQL